MSWRWMLGLLLMVIIPLPFDSMAFALAPQSLITPFGGLTLVLTQWLGPKFLKEKVHKQDYVYGFVILLGVTTSSVFGPTQEGHYTLDDLLGFWSNPGFIVMEALVLVMTAAVR
jgi:hypothetical protein